MLLLAQFGLGLSVGKDVDRHVLVRTVRGTELLDPVGAGQGGSLMKDEQELGAQVEDHTLGGAALGQGLAKHALVLAEEGFFLVGSGGDAGVFVACKQMFTIASGAGANGIDEVGGRDAEADPWGRAGEVLKEGFEAALSLGSVRALVDVRLREQMMGDLMQDVDVALHATGQMGCVPVGGQGLVQGI